MEYYYVLISGQSFHGNEPLTYSIDHAIDLGTLVEVPIRNTLALGVVVAKATKPSFSVRRINKILAVPPLPATALELMQWLPEYYPAPLGYIVSLFILNSLKRTPRLLTNSPVRSSSSNKHLKSLPSLTKDQQHAVDTVQSCFQSPKTILLHGITGSGKTRVYLELARQSLSIGKSVLLLTPEIGLTSPVTHFFANNLNEEVISIHSGLSIAQRRNTWLRILNQKHPQVIIGPRSALFSPIKKLGIIIIDEAHDSAYKQEQLPRYQALPVASKLAKIHKAPLVLGTATPTLSDYFMINAKKLPIVNMRSLASSQSSGLRISLVDLKQQSNFSRHNFLSDTLLSAIDNALMKGEQCLLFLNRRGTARLIICSSCGWQATCPNCDLPMTYHGDYHNLQCHTCGHRATTPSTCPQCSSADIVFKSIGTKAIESAIQQFYPKAIIGRFDADNKKAEQLVKFHDELSSGKINILIGTQILAKGLDLPKLSLVGVIVADTSLYFPDYTAEEQTFQLLNQVMGRVGRGHRKGHVVIQAYQPNSSAIQTAVSRDWHQFYDQQIIERKLYGFPPFCFLLKITVSRKSAVSAKRTSNRLVITLKSLHLAIQVVGPAPCFLERTNGKYNYQIIVKAKNRNQLIEVVNNLPSGISYDLDPTNLL